VNPHNRLERIKAALGPERTMVFMEIMNILEVGPNDPEMILVSAMASFILDILEFRAWASQEREAWKEMFAAFLASIGLQIAAAFTRGADEFQTELRLSARETAQSEYRAGASLRSQAITDEVEALKTAALEFGRLAAELKARQAVEPARVSGISAKFTLSPQFFGAVAAAFVLGWVGALVMLHSAPRHAFVAPPRAVAQVSVQGRAPSTDLARRAQRVAYRAVNVLGENAIVVPAAFTTRISVASGASSTFA
jgi:hypothetical protein